MTEPLFEVGHRYPTTTGREALVVHRFSDGRLVCVAHSTVSNREYVFVVQADGREGASQWSANVLVQPDPTEGYFV